MTISVAGVFTLLAYERLLSSVNKHMSFQLRSRSGGVGTDVAAMGFLSSLWDGLDSRGHCEKLYFFGRLFS